MFGRGKDKRRYEDSIAALYRSYSFKILDFPDSYLDGSALDLDDLLSNWYTVLDFLLDSSNASELDSTTNEEFLRLMWFSISPHEVEAALALEEGPRVLGRTQAWLTLRVQELGEFMLSRGNGAAERALATVAAIQRRNFESSGRDEEIIQFALEWWQAAGKPPTP